MITTGATTVANTTGSFQFSNVPVAVGNNPLQIQATDLANNSATASMTVQRATSAGGTDPVLLWNQITLGAIATDADAPTVASRALAIESLSVYDAISAIDGTPGYLLNLVAPAGASVQAAVASAADTALDYLYPGQAASFDAQLALSLSSISNGLAKTEGIAFGQQVAQAIIALRDNDGWNNVVVDNGSGAVGQWQPTAPMYVSATTPQWATLTPFALTSPNQFLPPAPPAMTSAAYADAVNQTESLGSSTSTTRTADQTQIALFWNDQTGTYTPPGQWNSIADSVAQQQGNSMATNAQMLAELNVAEADSAIAAWNTKFTYNAWRPVQAIQNANDTGNSAIVQNSTWMPLITTPPFPEYVAGHPTFSEAAVQILNNFFGTSYAFTATSESLPGVTRSFSSFQQAATEAGMSRIYGGIHFQFSVDGGWTLGQEVGDWVLNAFDLSQDTVPPKVVVDQTSGFVTDGSPVITGHVTDNLSGAASLAASVNGGAAVPVTFDATTGAFSFATALPNNGTADGKYTVVLAASDAAGNAASNASQVSFTLDTKAPVITLDPVSIQDGGILSANAFISGIANPTGSPLASLTLSVDGGTPAALPFDSGSDAFAQILNQAGLAVGTHTFTVTATNSAGNAGTDTLQVIEAALTDFKVTSLTPDAGSTEIGVTYRPAVTFSRAFVAGDLNSSTFYATDTAGNVIPATVTPFAGNTGGWLLFQNPLPGSSTITLHLVGANIHAAADGALLDPYGTNQPGITGVETFQTVATAAVPGTTIHGIVVDPGPDLTPMTPDDVKGGPQGLSYFPGDTWKLPIAGVKVYVLGDEQDAVFTDAKGNFTLTNVPGGDVKVVVDGTTATNPPAGTYFPAMTMDLNVKPGVANTIAGDMGTPEQQAGAATDPAVYLPRIDTGILTTLSTTVPTTLTAPSDSAGASGINLTSKQISELSLTVQPNSLVDENGNPVPNARMGISPVPASIVNDMLPAGLQSHTFDITIQAPGGAVLTQPASMTAPNVFGLAPGEKTYVLSFDHTTGRLVVDGTATVSADGQTVTTDPGTGVLAPGWHGFTDKRTNTKAPIKEKTGPVGADVPYWTGAANDAINLAVTGAPYVREFVARGIAVDQPRDQRRAQRRGWARFLSTRPRQHEQFGHQGFRGLLLGRYGWRDSRLQ